MKKIFKKAIISLMAVVCCFNMFSCKKDDPSTNNVTTINSTFGKHDNYFVTPTDNYFIRSGKSDYVVVTPVEMPAVGEFAVSELQYFLKLATGVDIPVITERETLGKSQKYISVGKTRLWEEKGFEIDANAYKNSGFQIKSDDENVYIFSSFQNNNYEGVLCGVYEFLANVIGLEIYAEDCYEYVSGDTVKMPKFDIEEIPDFDSRVIKNIRSTYVYAYRMRMFGRNETPSVMEGHNQLWFLEAEDLEGHDDWLGAKKDVLCYTAYETGMDEAYAKNAINVLLKYPTQNYLFFGIPDMVQPCSCDRCIATQKKYNTNASGLNIIFLNKVIERIIDYFAVADPDRYITFGTYAYEGVFAPPAHLDENGNYVPDDPLTVPHERLLIVFAPVTMDYITPLNSEENKSYYEAYRGWNSIAKNMDTFEYPYYYYAQTVCHPSINTFVDNFRLFAQGVMNNHFSEAYSYGSPFFEIKVYLEAKLLWNVNYDHNELIRNFIKNYYGPAAEEIQEYFDFLMGWNAGGTLVSAYWQTKASEIYNSTYLPKSVLNTQEQFLNKSYEKIKQESDPEKYEKLKGRIDKLYFLNEVNRLETYYTEMSDEEIHETIVMLKDLYYSLQYHEFMGAPGKNMTYEAWFKSRDTVKE